MRTEQPSQATFAWENVGRTLSKDLARAVGLRVTYAASDLEERYGTPPSEDFVKDTWAVLRDRWLATRPDPRRAVAEELRAGGLGNPKVGLSSKSGQMDFLRGLRQSATLRSAVLQVFIDGHLGVQSPEDSSGSGEPASHPGAASADEMIRQAAESLSRLDEAGVARLEQHLWLQLERAERAAKAESLSLETAAEQAVWGALTAILMAGTTDAEPVVEPSPHRALVARGGPAVASSDGVLVLLRRLRALHTAPPSSRDDHGSVKFVLTEFASLLASVAEAGGSPYMEAFESVVDSGSAPIHSWNAQESDGESFAPPPPPSPQVVLPDQDPPRSAQPLMERMQDLFTGPDGKKPHPDKDGDLSIAFNSALIYLRAVEHDGEFPTVRLLSYIVREVERTPELLDILNQLNAHIPFGHCFFEPTANSIVMAHRISARKFNDDDFLHVVYTFGEHADHLDTMLARQFGGRRFGQDSREVIVS